jgi:hypothetical protein
VTATNGTEPAGFDLAGYRAAHAEATHKLFHVELGVRELDDGTLEVDAVDFPEQKQWTLEAQNCFAEGDIVEGIRQLLGPEQALLFNSYDWRFGEVEALFEALAKWSGFDRGQLSSKPRVRELTRR